MGIFKKILAYLTLSSNSDEHAYRLLVRCNRCGEIIESRIDLRNDLSMSYEDSVDRTTSVGAPSYFCRKTLIGKQRCFQRVEVTLTFDQNRKILDRQITGGEFVSGNESVEE
ncbi:MAG: hypothetical protein IBX69_07255 [Anaerolineales bacterium]|nr:hypothetical protein [Anaerolineales bacterium]